MALWIAFLLGIRSGVVVDDDLPTSRDFLKKYKSNVKRFRSINVPYGLFYLFCYLWEKYADKSGWQLPPVFNRKRCEAYWKGNSYTNKKLKQRLGWEPRINFEEALERYFNSFKITGATEC